MRVPIEGNTPGLRYGHTMVYIMPVLILFGGSGKNEILNDIWILSTDKTPFKWEKLSTPGYNPIPRVYHTANLYKVQGNEMMIVFGGRDKDNNSLCDIAGLKRKENSEWEWIDFPKGNSDINPIARHQQCAALFGPFLFVVGGRVGGKDVATFDVYSLNKLRWYRFGSISLFRHSIWIYYNIYSQEKFEVFLYIYGGFDGDNNSQINSNLFRINIYDLFSKEESLKYELSDHINSILVTQNQKKNRGQPKNEGNKAQQQFHLNSKVVVHNVPDMGEKDLGAMIKIYSYSKLTEVDRKIVDNKTTKRKYEYDESVVREFLQMLPSPDEPFIPLMKNDRPIILNRDYILNLINGCKSLLENTPTVIKLKHPIKIFGSLHGQYNDLMRYFSLWGRPHEHRGDIECMEYLFLGNAINRGGFSIEVLCLLLALKIKHPDQVHILRGSQDELKLSLYYGLAEECKNKLEENVDDPSSIFRRFCDLFDYFPLAATINDKILCVHSGIGENTKTIEDILAIKKPYNVYDTPGALDILWNTPAGCTIKDDYTGTNFTSNLRKRTFNENQVTEFMKTNKINLIIRSHDVLESGFEKLYDNRVISIFSATNYCGVYKNSGGILFIKKNSEIQPKILTCEDDYTIWSKNDNMLKEFPPSPKKSYKK